VFSSALIPSLVQASFAFPPSKGNLGGEQSEPVKYPDGESPSAKVELSSIWPRPGRLLAKIFCQSPDYLLTCGCNVLKFYMYVWPKMYEGRFEKVLKNEKGGEKIAVFGATCAC